VFTNKDINTLTGLFYAASCAHASPDPTVYYNEFSQALDRYFSCYPNDVENDDIFQSGDFPVGL